MCTAGKSNSDTASSSENACDTCGVNTFSEQGASTCTACHSTQNSLSGSDQQNDCKCNAGYVGNDGANSCTACEPGKFKDGTNPGVCTACVADTYSGATALVPTVCKQCPTGSSTVGNGKTHISDCECDEGKYEDSTSDVWTCKDCQPGKYSDEPHSPSCSSCPINTYLDALGGTNEAQCQSCTANSESMPGSGSSESCLCKKGYSGSQDVGCTIKYNGDGNVINAECTQCSDGKVTTSGGEDACVMCGTGKYASGNHDECLECPADTYCDQGMKMQCENFRANTHNPNPSSSDNADCVCVAGTYLDGAVCEICTANYFCTGINNGRSECPANSESLVSSESDQECTCSRGYSGANGGPCVECGVGTYKDQIGDVACSSCESGNYNGQTASTTSNACKQCAKGTASNLAIAGNCATCVAGTFSNTLGAETCTPCSYGQWSNIVGATTTNTCQWCDAGKYQMTMGADAESDCFLCPTGKTKTWS